MLGMGRKILASSSFQQIKSVSGICSKIWYDVDSFRVCSNSAMGFGKKRRQRSVLSCNLCSFLCSIALSNGAKNAFWEDSRFRDLLVKNVPVPHSENGQPNREKIISGYIPHPLPLSVCRSAHPTADWQTDYNTRTKSGGRPTLQQQLHAHDGQTGLLLNWAEGGDGLMGDGLSIRAMFLSIPPQHASLRRHLYCRNMHDHSLQYRLSSSS